VRGDLSEGEGSSEERLSKQKEGVRERLRLKHAKGKSSKRRGETIVTEIRGGEKGVIGHKFQKR